MTNSYLNSVLGHPQLQFAFFLPLCAVCFFGFLREPAFWRALLLSLTTVLAFLTTVYYALFCVFLLILLTASLALIKPAIFRKFERNSWLSLAGGALAGLFPLIPFLLPYWEVKGTFGARYLFEAEAFRATALSYVSSSPWNVLYSSLASLSHSEAHLFIGIVPFVALAFALSRLATGAHLRPRLIRFSIVLALLLVISIGTAYYSESLVLNYLCALISWGALIQFALLLRRLGKLETSLGCEYISDRDLIGIFCFVLLASFLVSLGPLGVMKNHSFAPGVYALFHYTLPGFSALRATGRIGLLVLFSLSLLFPLFVTSVQLSKKKATQLSLLCLVLVFVENLPSTYPVESPAPLPEIISSLEKKSAELPEKSAIILPYAGALKADGSIVSWGDFALRNVRALQWSTPKGITVVNGYSGQRSKIMYDYPRRLKGFPDELSKLTLREIPNLSYIAVPFPGELQNYSPTAELPDGLVLIDTASDGGLLFELNTTQKVTALSKFRIPSFPDQILTVEMKARSIRAEDIELSLFLKKHFERVPFSKITLPNDDSWHRYTIAMPKTSDTVRPLLLSFGVSKGGEIWMQEPSAAEAGS